MAFKRVSNEIPTDPPHNYDRQSNFTLHEVNAPGQQFRGEELDAEFDHIERAMDETQDRLALIQRSDGALRNESVHPEAISPETWLIIGHKVEIEVDLILTEKDITIIRILGVLNSPADLPAEGNPGDGWLIGANIWLWDVPAGAFVNAGSSFTGPQGPVGPQGAVGPHGATGDSGIHVGPTPPADTARLWLDTVANPLLEPPQPQTDPPINVNTADLATLRTLNGVNTSRAQAIIDGRPWASINDLSQIHGISAGMIAGWNIEV